MIIDDSYYKGIVAVLPILCVDVLVRDTESRVLLLKRAQEPLRGRWWVVGGRVHHGETLASAATRKVKEETNLQLIAPTHVGYYEDVYLRNPHGSILHTVSVVFKSLAVGDIKLDDTSSDFKWSDELPPEFEAKVTWIKELS